MAAFPDKVTVAGDTIDAGRGPIKVTAIKNPAELPYKELNVDIALECTGLFTARDKAAQLLAAGAKRVLVSAPGEGADITVVYGVNHHKITRSISSSPTPPARRIVSRRSPRCCMTPSASTRAS